MEHLVALLLLAACGVVIWLIRRDLGSYPARKAAEDSSYDGYGLRRPQSAARDRDDQCDDYGVRRPNR